MALYIPHSIFHLARLLYVRPETSGPYYVYQLAKGKHNYTFKFATLIYRLQTYMQSRDKQHYLFRITDFTRHTHQGYSSIWTVVYPFVQCSWEKQNNPRHTQTYKSWWRHGLRHWSAAVRLPGLRGFESRRGWGGHWCLSLASVMCWQRGSCDRPIPRPEESYRVCVYVTECDQVQQ